MPAVEEGGLIFEVPIHIIVSDCKDTYPRRFGKFERFEMFWRFGRFGWLERSGRSGRFEKFGRYGMFIISVLL